MSFPRYARYKDSGVAWLGEVPEEWVILPGRRTFRQKRQKAFASDEQLSATQRYGVIPQRLFMEQEDQKVVLALKGTDSFKHIDANDFVISLRSFQGGLEISRYSGCVSTAYTVLDGSKCGSVEFWAYLFKSEAYIGTLQSSTDGIREGKTISYDQFAEIGLPIPTLPEQKRVTEFLDRETGKIDALVEEQRRLIELLKEKRQAVISHAVTKGLNPNAPMKDSGVAWLGRVPAHWEVKPLGYLISISSGSTPDKGQPAFWDGTVPWVTPKDMKVERIADSEDHVSEAALSQTGLRLFPAKQVLVVVRGMILAHSFPISINEVEVTINQDMKALQCGAGLEFSFLFYILKGMANVLVSMTDESAHGTKKLDTHVLSNFFIPVPSTREQTDIVHAVQQRLASLDDTHLEAANAITLLQERRSALISAAVTGKIDVRGHTRTQAEEPEQAHVPA